MGPLHPAWRGWWTTVHRWAGLFIALFLIMSGVTGAIMSWDHEIDEWLNADLFHNESKGAFRTPLELAAAIEADDPRTVVIYLSLSYEEGHNGAFFVRPKVDPATGQPFKLGYNQVYVDPVTAQVKGRRDSRAVSMDRRHLMPFLRKLHYTLHIPSFAGTDRWGYWLMGTVSMVWLFDSFVGFYLTLPRRARLPHARKPGSGWWSRWKPAWLIRWGAASYKVNFDLHRAFGLWTWGLIFVIAFTSSSLNLRDEIFYPALALMSPTTPSVTSKRQPAPLGTVITPKLGFAEILAISGAEANRRGWTVAPGGLFYNSRYGFYNASFFQRGNEHGSDGMGLRNLYLDGADGRILGDTVPWQGTAADVFMQLQLPLHSGRILGLPGQILVSLMGVVVAGLSITGLVIWIRKRRARLVRALKRVDDPTRSGLMVR